MQPIFTLPYSEYKVADVLNQKFKSFSVFVPTSSQEKGIDLILYNRKSINKRVLTIQVKSSRVYMNNKISTKQPFKHYLWLNRFQAQENADLFFLIGIYPKSKEPTKDLNCNTVAWSEIILVFTYDEMKAFLENVRLKKNSEKEDKMFGFGFDEEDNIHWTRGCQVPTLIRDHLLKNRIDIIKRMIE